MSYAQKILFGPYSYITVIPNCCLFIVMKLELNYLIIIIIIISGTTARTGASHR
jgi:hypothetical protein